MGDLARHPAGHRIAQAVTREGLVEIEWQDGVSATLHPIWLRSECGCPTCRDRVTFERNFDHFRLPEDLEALSVEATADGALRVVWAGDGHLSLFDPDWLRAHVALSNRSTAGAAWSPRLWGAELSRCVPTFSYSRVMDEDRALEDWLYALCDVGLTLLRDVPGTGAEVERLARRISFPRHSNFGTIFDVIARGDANSNAYTAIELPPHVDLPTREYQPGYQVHHCLANQAAGGESTYVDGFALAEHLRASEPATFALLTTEPIPFRFYDRASDYRWSAPVIGLDGAGRPVEVRFNPWLTAPLVMPAARFAEVYAALRRFANLSRDPRFQIRRRLDAGTMSVYDNRRVLHGRAAFDEAGGQRHFRGCYLEREEVASRLRVLERAHAGDT